MTDIYISADSAGCLHTLLTGKLKQEDFADDEITVLAPGSIVNSLLASGAVETGNLAAGAVTGAALGIGTLQMIKKTVTYNGGATQAIGTLPAKSLLISAISMCNTSWDGTDASISVGYTGGAGNIFDGGSVSIVSGAEAGDDTAVSYAADTWVSGVQNVSEAVTTWGHPKFKFYTSQTVVNAYVTPGTGAAHGSTDIMLFYIQTQ